MDNEEKPRTLREYIAHLRKFTRKYGDLPVVYSRDDMGNRFQPVNFTPVLGYYDGWGEFQQYQPEDSNNECEKEDINALCVN